MRAEEWGASLSPPTQRPDTKSHRKATQLENKMQHGESALGTQLPRCHIGVGMGERLLWLPTWASYAIFSDHSDLATGTG